jgi:hypothetical protein
MQDLTGQTLGQYRIVAPLGKGGMATVFRAYQPSLDRYVAVKVLPPYYAHEPGFSERFSREARAVARLEHPHILPIYDFGQEGDYTYLVIKYVPAGTLKDLLAAGRLPLEQTVEIVSQVAAALDYAHRHGIIHRDVKPSNVLMDRGEWALLMDFGLAKMVEGSKQLTASGVGVGTPAYMAPEQGRGEQVDGRADVYALGIVLFEMVTGQVPFDAETPMAVVLKHITDPLPMPRTLEPSLPEGVERVILKALAKSPADRYATAGELADALKRAAWRDMPPAPAAADSLAAVDALLGDEPLPETAPPPEFGAPLTGLGAPLTGLGAPLTGLGGPPIEFETPSTELGAPPPEDVSIAAEGAPSPAQEQAALPSAPQVKRRADLPSARRAGRRRLPWWAWAGGTLALLVVVAAILAATGIVDLSGGNGGPAPDELPAALPATVNVIVDNLSDQFRIQAGHWEPCMDGDCEGTSYGDDFLYAEPGCTTCQAQFLLYAPAAGEYELRAWWPQGDDRATDTPFVVRHSEDVQEINVDQRGDGSRWVHLATLLLEQGEEVTVVVHGSASGYANVDAVALTPLGARREPPASLARGLIVDNTDPGFVVLAGEWETTGDDGEYGDDFAFASPDCLSCQARFAFEVSRADEYELWTWWPQGDDRATDTPYTIRHRGGEWRVNVDQRHDGSRWVYLDTLFLEQGETVEVIVGGSSSGYANADAVALLPAGEGMP